MISHENHEITIRISSAKGRLKNKLKMIDLAALDISEYNQRYLGGKIKNIDRQLDLYGNILTLCFLHKPLTIQQSVFVDYGGGSGILSYLAKELGIDKVIYIDIYDKSCNDVKIISNMLELPIDHVICGDVGDLISFVTKNSIIIDSIASYDVLEHIYDVGGHFKNLASLGYRFRVVYGSGANCKNPRIVHDLKKKQIMAENENREKIWGHKERDSLLAYYNIRKDIISSYSPDLKSNEINLIAEKTRGLIESDIKKCVDEFKQTGYVSYSNKHPTNTCDPYTGNWCEHLIEPEWLENILLKYGYSVKILGGYYHSTASRPKKFIANMINSFISLLGRHSLIIAPYFIVIADHNPCITFPYSSGKIRGSTRLTVEVEKPNHYSK